NLYVADGANGGRVQERDTQGRWAVLVTHGTDPGQVSNAAALAVDGAGNLYVADRHWIQDGAARARVQERDAQGRWTVLATYGADPGQVSNVAGLAVDTAANLYVADIYRIQERDAQGHWTVLFPLDSNPGQLGNVAGLTVDGAGNLY